MGHLSRRETLHPKRNEGLVACSIPGGDTWERWWAGLLGGQDASVLCGDAEDTPGRRKWELRVMDGVGWGSGAGLSVLLPSVPQTLHPAGLAVSPVHPELHPCAAWGSLCGGRARRGTLVNTCQETGALTLLCEDPLSPGPYLLRSQASEPNGLVQRVASQLVFVCLFPKRPPA